MKLTFRTITGRSFQIDAEDGTKIGDLKAMVESSQGSDFPKDGMKLVYKGKVLDKEDVTVSESGVTDAGFVVVFIQKRAEPPKAAELPAAAAAPAATAAATSAAATPAAPEAPAASAAPAAPAAAAASSAPAAAAAAPSAAAGSGLLSGSGLEEAISNIVEMGFPREEVAKAMRAAFNNPERAVEYLMTGIPAQAQAPPQAAPRPAAPRPAAAAGAGGGQPAAPAAALPFDMFGGGGAGAAAPAGPLDFLRTNPQFLMLRRAVQVNPQILVPMMQELGKSNPELLTQINAHHQEFLRLLTEAPEAEGEGGMEDAMEELMGQMGGGGGVEIELTAEEAAAIQRLENLGFERNACIEAFLSCDKNEELAANFLAEQMFD